VLAHPAEPVIGVLQRTNINVDDAWRLGGHALCSSMFGLL
jgi:hypothetical protein